ncbi:uncharacterized protein LOC134530492 [Bacillus rossius redtenbacheri]|uniref:uncharacterized protein LOC134530492 n=1 Tax=Bacillus rossius redtenbacheri TaxID=93214 RepID=UPI002FDDF858
MQSSTNPFAASSQPQYGTDNQNYGAPLKSLDGQGGPFSPEAQKFEESLMGEQGPPPAYPLPIQGHPGYQAVMSSLAGGGQRHNCPLCDVVEVISREEPHSVPQKIETPMQAMLDLCCHFYCGNTWLMVTKYWRSRIVWKALCYPLAVIVLLVVIVMLISI